MIDRQPVSKALAALLASVSGRPVGRGKKPPNAGQHYYVLYSLDTAIDGAPLTDMGEDLSPVYQVTSVSGPDPSKPGSVGDPDQVEWMADKARKVFLGRDPATGLWLHPLTLPGISVMGRALDIEAGATSDASDGIISYVQRFKFYLTSA